MENTVADSATKIFNEYIKQYLEKDDIARQAMRINGVILLRIYLLYVAF